MQGRNIGKGRTVAINPTRTLPRPNELLHSWGCIGACLLLRKDLTFSNPVC
jgi:hypothetical protein